eukprot:TRINITY_DN398_c0_g1_i1.p1 TRINITY_DN398_c0_g1~~TRINITY_DN398_c0_g1_i1.p1  ORF type:complete len:129 (-),score=25.52 TRINITY_DN398_c0_g1_i1:77-463(-)
MSKTVQILEGLFPKLRNRVTNSNRKCFQSEHLKSFIDLSQNEATSIHQNHPDQSEKPVYVLYKMASAIVDSRSILEEYQTLADKVTDDSRKGKTEGTVNEMAERVGMKIVSDNNQSGKRTVAMEMGPK